MINKCAEAVAEWLINCDEIKEADRELYKYAVYSIFLSLSPVFLAIGCGVFLGAAKESVLIVLPFVVIRKFSGGYHANKSGLCMVESSLLLLLCIILSFYISCNWILVVITMLAVVSLACFSPVDHENRYLDQEERSYCKRKTIIFATGFLIICTVLIAFGVYKYAVCISIGIIMSAGIQLPCVVKKLMKGTKQA